MGQGWSGSTRRERLPEDWRQKRAYILERDGFRCRALLPDGRRCPNDASDVDHVMAGDDHSYSNLQALCKRHHARKSAEEGGRASQTARKKRRRLRPAEKHWRPDGSHLPGGDADS